MLWKLVKDAYLTGCSECVSLIGTSCWKRPAGRVCLSHSGMGPRWWYGWRYVLFTCCFMGTHCGISHLPNGLTFLFLCLALGWDACLVCGCLPSKCQEWCHHVSPVRHRDPAGDRHQQPSAQAEAAAGHPGDYVTNQPFCPTHIQDGKFTCSYALGGRTASCKAMDQSFCFLGSLQPQQFSFKTRLHMPKKRLRM